jgi:hypothetical protein
MVEKKKIQYLIVGLFQNISLPEYFINEFNRMDLRGVWDCNGNGIDF